jgi:hypothetical protein
MLVAGFWRRFDQQGTISLDKTALNRAAGPAHTLKKSRT